MTSHIEMKKNVIYNNNDSISDTLHESKASIIIWISKENKKIIHLPVFYLL